MDDTFRDPDATHGHIDVCLTGTVEYQRTAGFERFDFVDEALSELSLAALDRRPRWTVSRCVRRP